MRGERAGDLRRAAYRIKIERTEEDQGGHPDIRKSVEHGWVEFALLDVVPVRDHLEGPHLRLSHEVTDRRIDVPGVWQRTVDPPGEVRLHGTIQVVTGQLGPLGFDERTQIWRDFTNERSTRRAEKQRSHSLGPGQRNFDGHASAEGGANEVTAVNVDRFVVNGTHGGGSPDRTLSAVPQSTGQGRRGSGASNCETSS